MHSHLDICTLFSSFIFLRASFNSIEQQFCIALCILMWLHNMECTHGKSNVIKSYQTRYRFVFRMRNGNKFEFFQLSYRNWCTIFRPIVKTWMSWFIWRRFSRSFCITPSECVMWVWIFCAQKNDQNSWKTWKINFIFHFVGLWLLSSSMFHLKNWLQECDSLPQHLICDFIHILFAFLSRLCR